MTPERKKELNEIAMIALSRSFKFLSNFPHLFRPAYPEANQENVKEKPC